MFKVYMLCFNRNTAIFWLYRIIKLNLIKLLFPAGSKTGEYKLL